MENEEWAPVSGFETAYEVSTQGRVRSKDRVVEDTMPSGVTRKRIKFGTVLRPLRHTNGYVRVTLWRSGVAYNRFIHALVLTAFAGARPSGRQACHNNGDKTDNRLINLRWDTPSANQADRVKHGTAQSGRTRDTRRYSKEDADIAVAIFAMTKSISETARRMGMPRTTVSGVIKRGICRADGGLERWLASNASAGDE